MNEEVNVAPAIREDVLRDPRHPVHLIADRLLPYLRVLVDEFQPVAVILFGSYAYGHPGRDSDIDLLVVKRMTGSAVRETSAILKAWRPLRKHNRPMAFELRVESPENHEIRSRQAGTFYAEVSRRGIRVV